MAKQEVLKFSKPVIASSIGVTVIQVMDFHANEIKIPKADLQQIWSPFAAAIYRFSKENADSVMEIFISHAKNTNLHAATQSEYKTPNLVYYEDFASDFVQVLKVIAESIYEYGYSTAITDSGNIDKKKIANDLNEMFSYYLNQQSLRKHAKTDELFLTFLSMAVTQNIEDLIFGNKTNGATNTATMMQAGQVVFATAFVLYISNPNID